VRERGLETEERSEETHRERERDREAYQSNIKSCSQFREEELVCVMASCLQDVINGSRRAQELVRT
jgi:hypothetical protein